MYRPWSALGATAGHEDHGPPLRERLTPSERFQIVVAAFGRGDLTEVDRLKDSAPSRTVKIQEPVYFDRLQRITWLALYFSVHARDHLFATLAVFAAMVLDTPKAGDQKGCGADGDGPTFHDLCGHCVERMSRLKALHSAWESFCTGVAVSASDVDTMIGFPLLASGDALALIEEIAGEVALDEEYQQQCLEHMARFCNTKIRDRYPE